MGYYYLLSSIYLTLAILAGVSCGVIGYLLLVRTFDKRTEASRKAFKKDLFKRFNVEGDKADD